MDPRSSYVISTHELGRQPGAMRKVDRDITAPDDLRTPVVGVVAGSPIRLDLRLESVQEGVLVTGEAIVQTLAECVRCLREVEGTDTVEISELYFYPGARQTALDEGDEEAEDMVELEGELLDLEPVLRDAVVTALPLHPLCEPDCQGLCPGCGERMADLPADHEHVEVDPRWAALAELAAGEQDADDDEDR